MNAVKNGKYGEISISEKAFQSLVGITAANCFGVVGMAGRNNEIVRLFKKEAVDRGVSVKLSQEGTADIELHVIVEYGVNIPAITESIINRVKYFVETTTGYEVSHIEVIIEYVRV